MAKFDVYDLDKKKVGELELADAVFAGEVNEHLFYEVVKAKLASDRSGTHAVKNRSLVSGGGKKPWKQKHTGRARQGSTRASQWVGGGKAMGPKPRDYSYDVPKKVRKAALRSALSLRNRDQKLVIVQEWKPAGPKTGTAAKVLAKLGARKALVVDGAANVALAKSVRNLAGSDFLPVEGLNVYDILRHDVLVLTADTAKNAGGQPVMTTLLIQDVVKRPLITEKNERARELARQFAFEVHRDATKIQVKQAVETLFKVHVLDVRTAIARGKNKRVGRSVGQRPNWKKAFVTLKEGETIALFEGT